MDRKIPLDFPNIKNLFEDNPKDICKLLIRARSIIFYDTNSFAFHSTKKERYYALDFFHSEDVVVFINPILREMNYKDTEKFPPWYLNYFKALREKVKSFILLDEKQYVNILKIGKPHIENIDIRIKQAFLNAFKQNKRVEKEIRVVNPKEKDFLHKLLSIADRKENVKNRGEIGIYIATQILCSLKEKANYKIFSDDYTAYPYMKELTNVLEKYYPKANIGYFSTIRNIQELANILSLDKEGILSYLNNIEREKNSKIFIKERPYDTCKRVIQTNEYLVENILNKSIDIKF